jgi:Cu-Zn family superoxide dismutase
MGPLTTFQISGLAPGDHGLHVHSLGVASDFNCTNSGSHYDPFKKAHGDVSAEIRHAGDLGNIVAGDDGVAPVDIWVPASEGLALKLSGDANIAGRALVIHGGADDKGLNTSNPESAKNGASGPRVGCGNM